MRGIKVSRLIATKPLGPISPVNTIPRRTSSITSLIGASRSYSNYSGSHNSSFRDHLRRRTLRLAPIIGIGGLILYLLPEQALADTSPSPSNSSSIITNMDPETQKMISSPRSSSSLDSTSSIDLIRSYLVYTACSIPFLIDYAPSLLHTFTHSYIPGLAPITLFLVRHSFFKQFVPGETVEGCLPTMRTLRENNNIGSVLNYSAEADLSGDGISEKDKRKVEEDRLKEVYLALEKSGSFENDIEIKGGGRGSTAFALKITGLIDPDILQRASTTLLRLRAASTSHTASSPQNNPPAVVYPGTPVLSDARVVARTEKDERYLLSLKGAVDSMGVLETDEGLRDGDLEQLKDLWGKLKSLGECAKANKVKLMIDAEHTWYQPALDAYTLLLMQEFNKIPKKGLFSSTSQKAEEPLIYGTFQSYLTRQPAFLNAAIKHAEDNGYVLGLKVVRGAYFVQERKKWKADKRIGADPIWPDKPATDESYNDSVRTIISRLSTQLNSSSPERSLAVVFGTHNEESCQLVVDCLKKEGLAVKGDQGEGSFKLRRDVEGKVYIAQLYGMKDDLTDRMASSFESSKIPFALKYIAYGNLSEVMPFLGRRAIENKSVMTGEGGASAERKRLSSELWRRVFG